MHKRIAIALGSVLISSLIAGGSAFAQSSSATSKTEADTGTPALKAPLLLENKTFQETSGITDAKIRAESGSLSRYSMKFNFSYYGPPVGDLGNENQPNPDGSIGNYSTAIGGSVSFNYRFSPIYSLSLGTGVNAVTPFHHLERFDVRTPYISLGRYAKIGEWQTRNSVGLSATTIPEYRNVGQFASVSYDAGFFHRIGLSRWSVGLDSSLSYFTYNREYTKKDGNAGRYNWGFYPAIKYKATDKFSAYLSHAITLWNPRKLDDTFAIWSRTPSQRLGIEYAFSRDIYFAPYLNFYAQNFNWRSTTVNFNTIFSVL